MPARAGEPGASLIVDGSELRELARVNAWVHDWTQREQLPERVATNIDLCSTEVVTNIITHACGDSAQQQQQQQQPHSILLRLGWQGDDVALEVEDEGSQFDLRQVPEPAPATTLQDARVGGWGIPMVRRFSDDVRYRHVDGRNCLTLLFHATAPP